MEPAVRKIGRTANARTHARARVRIMRVYKTAILGEHVFVLFLFGARYIGSMIYEFLRGIVARRLILKARSTGKCVNNPMELYLGF